MGVRTAIKEAWLDRGLSSTARKVRRDRLTYLSREKMKRIEAAVAGLDRAGVAGAFVEFGVALGGSSIVLATAAQRTGRAFHGFDVFGMIPPPTANDTADVIERYEIIRGGKSEGIGGDDYYGYRSDLLADVRASIARFGLGAYPALRLHKGLFEDTWPASGIGSVAFAHVDCDWFDPVTYCLNALLPVLSLGGVIVLDDYHDYESCRRATDEFLARTGDFTMDDGPNLILRRTEVSSSLPRSVA